MESGNSIIITSRVPEMDTKVEIKEEPLWIETPAAEVEDNPEETPVLDSVVKTETKNTEGAQIQVLTVLPEVHHSDNLKVQHESKIATHIPLNEQQQQSAAETDSRKDPTCGRIGLQKRPIRRSRPGIESSVLQSFRESSENFISSLNKIADSMEEANKLRAQNLKLKMERARMRGIDID